MASREYSLEREIIQNYFYSGYSYEIITELLKQLHNINMSVRTLKRRLKDYGLRRNQNEVNEDELRNITREEINTAGRTQGYRAVWHTLRLERHLCVPRQQVANVIKELDPEGVELRQRHRFTRRRYLSCGPIFC